MKNNLTKEKILDKNTGSIEVIHLNTDTNIFSAKISKELINFLINVNQWNFISQIKGLEKKKFNLSATSAAAAGVGRLADEREGGVINSCGSAFHFNLK